MAQQAFSLVGKDVFVSLDDDDPTKAIISTANPSELPKIFGLGGQPRGAWDVATSDYINGDVVTDQDALFQLVGLANGTFAAVGVAPSDPASQWTKVADLGSPGYETEEW